MPAQNIAPSRAHSSQTRLTVAPRALGASASTRPRRIAPPYPTISSKKEKAGVLEDFKGDPLIGALICGIIGGGIGGLDGAMAGAVIGGIVGCLVAMCAK